MEPFVGQIMAVGFSFAPRGWALCDGQLLPISQNNALFSLLGTTYGGDGRTTFGLPDLRGRVAIHQGHGTGLSNHPIGQQGGVETVNLTTNEIPSHTHIPIDQTNTDQHVQLSTSNAVNETPAAGDVPAIANFADGLATKTVKAFGPPSNAVNGQKLNGAAGLQIGNTGGSQGHTNIQPFLTINYIIALVGIYPSRS